MFKRWENKYVYEEHLEELSYRLKKMIVSWLGLIGVGIYYRKELLYVWIEGWIVNNDKHKVLMYTDIWEGLYINIFIIWWSIIIWWLPQWLLEIRRFKKCGMYEYEDERFRKDIRWLWWSYWGGVVIGYKWIIPLIIKTGIGYEWEGVVEYEGRLIEYIWKVFVIENSIICIVVCIYLWWLCEIVIYSRKYIIMGILIIIGSVTPPDIWWLLVSSSIIIGLIEIIGWGIMVKSEIEMIRESG